MYGWIVNRNWGQLKGGRKIGACTKKPHPHLGQTSNFVCVPLFWIRKKKILTSDKI